MLLYAIYQPSAHNESSWNRSRVYAFASVERLVTALRQVNGSGTGTLEMVTKEEAYHQTSIARLYTGIDENGVPEKDGAMVMVHNDSLSDGWSRCEIPLTQTIADEKVHKSIVYP